MRRFSVPFPLVVVAAANLFTVTACTVLAGPFGRGTAASVTARDRTARRSGMLAPPSTRQGGGGFDPADAYTPLTVDAQGRAAGAMTVPLLMPTEGRYHVSVAASAADSETAVAFVSLAARSR